MAPPKVTKTKIAEDLDAYSIDEFCRRHGISLGTYYNLKRVGRGPREGRAFSRVLISKESAARWRKQIEKDSRLLQERKSSGPR